MKKLNVLALCAVLAPAYMLGFGNVAAEEQDKSCETHQHAGETIDEENGAERDGTASAPSAETGDGRDTADTRAQESQEPRRTDQPAGSGDTDEAAAQGDHHCAEYTNN